MTVPEVLAAGSERSARSARPRAWVVRHRWWLTGAVVLVVALVALDQWEQRREMSALLTEVSSGEQAIAAASGSLKVVVDYYSPLVFSADVPQDVRDGLRTDVIRAASGGVADVRAASNATAEVFVLPWHHALREARGVYVERTEAWTSYLDAVAAEPASLFRSASYDLPAVAKARRALEQAAPWAGTDLRRQVDALLVP